MLIILDGSSQETGKRTRIKDAVADKGFDAEKTIDMQEKRRVQTR